MTTEEIRLKTKERDWLLQRLKHARGDDYLYLANRVEAAVLKLWNAHVVDDTTERYMRVHRRDDWYTRNMPGRVDVIARPIGTGPKGLP